jgi:hypothetical protein
MCSLPEHGVMDNVSMQADSVPVFLFEPMYGLTIRKNRPVSDDPGDVFWQRQYTDQFGAWFRKKAASNPRTFALLPVVGCALTAPSGGIGCAIYLMTWVAL